MAFSFGFFNAKNLDRTYTAENFCDYLGSIICNGIQDNYGRCFDLSAGSGLSVTVGTGKAWIDGHYFINDARYSIDLSEYMDESLPRYVGIAIYLDTTEAVRNVSLRLFPGTPAENPGLPSIPQDEDHVRLLMYAVRLNPGAASLSDRDWFDYREDRNVCGYCRCILGKCKVTDMLAEMAQINATLEELQAENEELANQVAALQTAVEDIGDVVEAGQCGESVFYVRYSTGKVLLRGSGAMYEYDSSHRSPFYANDDVKTVVIAEGVTSVGYDAFMRCENLESVSLPTTVSYIGSGAFLPDDSGMGAHGKLTSITLPQALTEIGGGAFWSAALTSLTVPPNVSTMGNYVCRECSRLQSVRYEGSVIGGYMFGGCSGLTEFTMAHTVTRIGEHCFNYCTNLETITYEGSLADWALITKGTNWAGKSGMESAVSGLTRIQCLDGHLDWDAENHEWVEVHD